MVVTCLHFGTHENNSEGGLSSALGADGGDMHSPGPHHSSEMPAFGVKLKQKNYTDLRTANTTLLV